MKQLSMRTKIYKCVEKHAWEPGARQMDGVDTEPFHTELHYEVWDQTDDVGSPTYNAVETLVYQHNSTLSTNGNQTS